jgi:3,4-dihydroxy 2-butanone 4-phosphate synthase/GTP cyclohydrolase II
MTNNPAKYRGLSGYGITIVERLPLRVTPNEHNLSYLRTKAERMNHALTDGGSETGERFA